MHNLVINFAPLLLSQSIPTPCKNTLGLAAAAAAAT